jgi:hypothetical protein
MMDKEQYIATLKLDEFLLFHYIHFFLRSHMNQN